MQQRVSLITLDVKSLARARQFYDALSWQVSNEDQAEEIIAYDLPHMTLCLYPLENLAADTGLALADTQTQTQTHTQTQCPRFALAYNVETVDQVAALLEQAVACGGRLIKPAEAAFWGGTSGYFTDPDGTLWEVAHNPHAPLSATGSFQWNGAKN